ncbi:MAG: hypothetical protein WBZ29_16105 [Methanocella sp.]
MSSMENGSAHFGFHAISQSAAWRRQQRCGSHTMCRPRARKASGGIYDEPAWALR